MKELSQTGNEAARSPLRFVITLLISIFGTETAIMFLLPILFPGELSEVTSALLDSTFLTLIISPVVWSIVIRPLRVHAQQLSDLNQRLSGEISEREALEGKLRHQATHDVLTGLPNRALFMKQLERTIRRKIDQPHQRFGVLFIDLDRFKSLNDTLGHEAGDLLLMQVAARFSSAVRPGDLVARLGGDEFTILLDDIAADEDVARVAQRIVEESEKPFVLEMKQGVGPKAHEVCVSASVGVVVGGDGHHQSAEHILRDADVAMYRAKSIGRDCFQIFDHSMHSRAVERLQNEVRLRSAIESLASDEPQFSVVYQPIVAAGSDRVIAFEALLRWNDPGRGVIMPGDFIPIAEETGTIIQLGRWVLHQACRQAREWLDRLVQTQRGEADHIIVSVNISAKQLEHPGLAAEVENALLLSSLPAPCLNLEVTESIAMRNLPEVSALLEQLRDLGVGLSIDDFGTGYSSLSYLHNLPFTALKIDRSFVSRMSGFGEGTEIVGTIMKLAQGLGLSVVAERVETAEQRDILRELGCNLFQGYLIAKPMTAEESNRLLLSSRQEKAAATGH